MPTVNGIKASIAVPWGDERLDQRVDQKIIESHLPSQYLDIALVAGQYKIYLFIIIYHYCANITGVMTMHRESQIMQLFT